jgi:phospholipid transport system transporter-binding protein
MAAHAPGSAAAGKAFTLHQAAPGVLRAEGALTFATARAARATGLAALSAAANGLVEIDCGAVNPADSAGLAVLLDWLALARGAGRNLRYVNLPQDLQALARIGEVEELLKRGV